ncbi:MAG: sulfatase-like hydrolase/transferase [Verrucomicrobiota bacterium]
MKNPFFSIPLFLGMVVSAMAAERPHIILIMVDDMGFSDLGYHGGEIDTPHLDQLAQDGVRFSQFYNSGRCCPTRATLMTGLHPHQTGIGWMTQPPGNTRGKDGPPAYQGFINKQCVTIGEVLKGNGYATLMAGKWHLGNNEQDQWPLQRGFEKYYGCIAGATRFFYPQAPRGMTLGNQQVEKPESTTDEAFYTTDAFTDYAIRFLKEEQQGKNRPSFLYLAYTAPHWPLQAFEDDIAKYRGKYKMGWDELRKARHQKQIDLGLIDPEWDLSPRTPGIPDWDSLNAKKQDDMDLKMAVYAAMVDRVDQNIGKLVRYLKEAGTFDNTLILFLSDNGACQEGGMFGRGNFADIEERNQQTANSYGEAWANAGSTPFRLYKHFAHEGGSATPFFMHWPTTIAKHADWYSEPSQLIDVMPTILDVTGAKYPKRFHGNQIPALDGVSLRPAFKAKTLNRKDPIFIEHENNAFVREGGWKLVGRGVAATEGVESEKWELYNMITDRTETRNLAKSNPGVVKSLAAKWDTWAARVGVYPKKLPNAKPPAEKSTKQVSKELPNPPQLKGREFMVSVSIDDSRPSGVALSHGGVAFGYALHFIDGCPAFSVRNDGKLSSVKARHPVSGKATISAALTAEQLSLAVNGVRVATAPSAGLLKNQPAIGLYLKEDWKDAVGDYKAPNRFSGKVLNHKFEVVTAKVSMRTKWGREVTPENVWSEYPRPAMKREGWTNLNGHWDYAVTSKDAKTRDTWDGQILVPFALEAPLSGVEHWLSPDEALWYRRSVNVEPKDDRRYLLNFEAVDYQTMVWVNGRQVGSNTGGNLPFSFDVTEMLRAGENEILLKVTDATDAKGSYQLHGKQRLNPRGIWYTPVSGIWQTVWMEEVPVSYIRDLKILSDLEGNVTVDVETGGDAGFLIGSVEARWKGEVVASASGEAKEPFRLKIPQPKWWSPKNPNLYDLTITIGEDKVKSYVGIREVGREKDAKGHWRFTLNGEPIFHWGTLDQGWWPDGLLTPPSDAALRSDIDFLKAAGFNTIRKHIKVEPRRFYTHCDRIGMLVWQDQVSAMAENPEWTRLKPNPETVEWPDAAHQQFMAELKQMIDTLHNHPSIVQWVPFNERWGQHRTMKVGKWTVDYDPTRQVNVASGGNFFPVGDIVDAHAYPHPDFPFDQNEGGRFDPFIKVMGEFGGHGFPVEGHVWAPGAKNWGYGGLPRDKAEWLERYRESIEKLAELKKQGVAAGIYTQTTDVEGEINGLLTYDREVPKISAKELAEIERAARLVE